jgi:hypothetical protein
MPRSLHWPSTGLVNLLDSFWGLMSHHKTGKVCGMGKSKLVNVGASLIAVGGVVVGVSAAIYGPKGWTVLSHNRPFQVGFGLVLLGAIMTLVWAMLPKDRTPIPEKHRQALSESVELLRSSILNARPLNYGGTDHLSIRREKAFTSHFGKSKELLKVLKKWDKAAQGFERAKSDLLLHLRVRANELAIDYPEFNVELITSSIQQTAIARAQTSQRTIPFTVEWSGFGDQISPSGTTEPWITVGSIQGEDIEDWRGRVRKRTERIERINKEAQMWDEAIAIEKSYNEAVGMRSNLIHLLEVAKDREIFLTVASCPVCQDNRR